MGAELDVRFVLEGSMRKIGDKARITAQLIETGSGDHAWSDSYDRPIDALDVVLDEVVDTIVVEAYVAITTMEDRRLDALDPEALFAADLCHLANMRMANMNLTTLGHAEPLIKRALEKSPNDVMARALMANIQAALPIYGSGNRKEHWALAVEHLEKAKSSGVPDIHAFHTMTSAATFMGRWRDVDINTEQLVKQFPWHPGTWQFEVARLNRLGNYEEALGAVARGRAVSTVRSPWYVLFLIGEATAHMGLRDFAKAERALQQRLGANDSEITRRLLVVALAHQGKIEEAQEELDNLRKFWGDRLNMKSAERLVRSLTDNDAFIAVQLEGLRLAGLEDAGDV